MKKKNVLVDRKQKATFGLNEAEREIPLSMHKRMSGRP